MAGKITYEFFLQCAAGICGNIGMRLSYPDYSDSFAIEFEREEGEIFFRKKLNGPLKFVNRQADGIDDYDCLYALDIDDIIHLTVFSSCEEYHNYPIYEGIFTLRECEIDEDNCTIEVNPIPNDIYDVIKREWDTKHNIMQAGEIANNTVHRNGGPEIFLHCKRLDSVIDYILGRMGLTITSRSTFFENDFTVDTDNYVTGLDPNPLNNLMVAHKSDVAAEAAAGGGGAAITFATTGEISLHEILDDLQSLYDIRWYIYTTGGIDYLRLEHISFFTDVHGIIDLTIMANNYDKQTYAWHTNKYHYVELPLREEFAYSEKSPRPDGWFHGSPYHQDYFYEYNTDPGQQDKKTKIHSVRAFMNDLRWICNYPAEPASDGFMLFQTYVIGAFRYVWSDNGGLAWSSLTDFYFQDNRPFLYAIYGFLWYPEIWWHLATFDTKQKAKEQVPVDFCGCCEVWDEDFNIWELVHTELGWGEIQSLNFNLTSGCSTVVLRYEAEDITQPTTTTPVTTPTTTPTTTQQTETPE